MTIVRRALGALLAALFATAALAQQEPLRIGFLTVRTGPLAAGGRQMEEGINLFLKERNNTLSGRKVQIFFADTAGQPAQAKTKAQELVERERVHVLVGPLATFEALALDEYVLQAKVPLLPAYREYGLKTTVFGNPTLTDEGILKNMGDEALGVYTASWYAVDHDTPGNHRFVDSIRKEYKVTPGFYTAATYTSGLWIEEAMKLVKDKFEDKAAFVKALHEVKLDHGPMGPLRLDEYGKPILNVYIRKVERRNGELVNVTVATYRDVSQFWKYDAKAFIAGPQYSRDYPPLRYAEP